MTSASDVIEAGARLKSDNVDASEATDTSFNADALSVAVFDAIVTPSIATADKVCVSASISTFVFAVAFSPCVSAVKLIDVFAFTSTLALVDVAVIASFTVAVCEPVSTVSVELPDCTVTLRSSFTVVELFPFTTDSDSSPSVTVTLRSFVIEKLWFPLTEKLWFPPTEKLWSTPTLRVLFRSTTSLRSRCACRNTSSPPLRSSKRSSLNPAPPGDESDLIVLFVFSSGSGYGKGWFA